ncbi:MAG: VOC family protein [Bdellovibrionota bacterium]
MSFQIKEFSTIRIFSDDVQKSRDWYKAFLGLEPLEDSENFVSFKIGQTCFDITVPDLKNPLSAGGTVGYWLVDDLDALVQKAESLGGKVYRGPLVVSEIQRTILQIQDPIGNTIGFECPIQ